MSEDRQEQCETCKWWDNRDFSITTDAPIGYCRRNPPQILVGEYGSPGRHKYEGIWNATEFPITEEEDFCGEWTRKNKPH